MNSNHEFSVGCNKATSYFSAYMQSTSNSSSHIRSSLDVVQAVGASLTFDGLECHGPNVGDIHDIEHTCQEFPGPGNKQMCSVSVISGVCLREIHFSFISNT